MKTLGNSDILKRIKIGYFAASKIASLSVLPTLDWATEIAKREDVAIISGFHSKMEKEVLNYLLKGKCGIICVLARGIYKKIPTKYKEAYDNSRVLFISLENDRTLNYGREQAAKRNEFIASTADELLFSSVTQESSLFQLTKTEKPIKLF